MAIPAVNAFYQGQGAGGGGTSAQVLPTVSGEVFAQAYGGLASGDIEGFCLPVLDGAATTFTLNWIDGTATLLFPPSGLFMFRTDPPAWTASTQYPIGAIVLGTGHVQQPTVAGKSASSAPTFTTNGTTVTETGSTLVWKDLGAIALSTITPVSATAITNLGATITISAVGTSTNVPVLNFRIVR
jgi:hypothetical protein